MTDVLLITGPMNRSQLGVPASPPYEVVQVHPTGPDIGSTAYHQAMRSWLHGKTLRQRLDRGPADRVGVAWFSAGHGAIKAILSGDTQPSDAQAWLCLDGLYGSNDFAVRLAHAAAVNHTSLMATASTSTPGHYDHSLDRWRDAVAKASIPSEPASAATQWGLPEPDELWGVNGCLVAGYETLGHHQQVPAVRAAMLRWWNAARAHEPTPPSPPPPTPIVPKAEKPELSPWMILGLTGVGATLGWMLQRLVNTKCNDHD